MTTSTLEATHDARRWIPADQWLRRRHNPDTELDARQRRLATLPADYEARASRADRGRRETAR